MAAASIAALVAAGPAWGDTTLNPVGNGGRANGTPTFSGTVTPDDPVTVDVWAGTSAAGAPTRSFTTPGSGGTFSDALPAPPLGEGTYTARAERAPNDKSATVTFVVDTTPPALTLVAPAAGSSTTDTTPGFGGAAGNSTGDGDNVVVKVYAGAAAVDPPLQTITVARNGAAWSAAAGELAAGEYTVQATQADDVGNSTVLTSTFSVVAQATPPTATGTVTPTTTPTPTPTEPPTTPTATTPVLLSPFPIVRIAGNLTLRGVRSPSSPFARPPARPCRSGARAGRAPSGRSLRRRAPRPEPCASSAWSAVRYGRAW